MKIDVNGTPPSRAEIAVHRRNHRRLMLITIVLNVGAIAAIAIGSAKVVAVAAVVFVLILVFWMSGALDRGYLYLPISLDKCKEVLQWQKEFPIVRRYVEELNQQGRELVHAEFYALRREVDRLSAQGVKDALYRSNSN